MVIKKSDIHGKGAFADKYYKEGEILTCDILEVPKGRIIHDYIFPFVGDRVCIHIGFANFINSSKEPNIFHLKIDTKNMLSYFKVLKNINEGEELTMNYL